MHAAIAQLISGALQECFGVSAVPFVVEHPKDMAHGDFATNAALLVASRLGATPQDIADKLVAYLREHKSNSVERVDVAGPGFINFTLTREVFVVALSDASKEWWGNSTLHTGAHILVEHSSPNLFKPFHIGHLMNNAVGESMVRLARMSGAQVTTLSFPSDISLGVAKAIFILLEKYGAQYVPGDVSVLGDAYAEGVKRYEEDESIHARVKEIADNLYGGKVSDEWTLFQTCKAFNIAYFEQVVGRLGSQFDSYIYESEAGITGARIVREHTPSIFTQSEGAIVYIPENDKFHTAVFINSQGNPTYEAKDIGLLDLKFERYRPDLSLFVTDAQQSSHFAVVLDAAKKIALEWAEKSLHCFHGRMSFKGQKMSSRLGGVPLASDVLDAVIGEVKEKNPDIAPRTAEQIGIAALKVAILRAQAGKNIDFDPDTSLSFIGDSGPYLQYTAVRAASLLAKARDAAPSAEHPITGTEHLERLIARFPETVELAQKEWAPHTIISYLLELAQNFNSWYGQRKIIDENTAATEYRLAVVQAVRNTLSKGLFLLGIDVPEKM